MQDCDEDLSINPFFLRFREQYKPIYHEAIQRQWIVCIPSVTYNFKSQKFDEKLVLHHVIRTDCYPLRTLADEVVVIENELLKYGGDTRRILFRESIYTNEGKISALCVSSYKPQIPPGIHLRSTTSIPTSQQRTIREKITCVKQILTLHSKFASGVNNKEHLELFINEIKECLSKLPVRISSCVIFNTHDLILDFINIALLKEEEELNKVRMNIIGVFQTETDQVFPEEFLKCSKKALVVLDKLSTKMTADAKLICLKETVNTLTQTDFPTQIHADTLLLLFSHLITYSSINNWNAQLCFMKNFNFSKNSFIGEESYYLSTVEAAILHLKSTSIPINIQHSFKNEEADIFSLTRNGDAAKLEELVYGSTFTCHPLCTCQFCGIPLVRNGSEIDANGFTALHYACLYGHTDITQTLLQTVFKNNTEAKDRTYGRTALHWAAYQGFQNCLLLLCHHNSNLDVTDKDGNNALHLAVKNGHESCVKALLYFAEHAHCKLDINARNLDGESALHLASRWGYASIVKLLMEWNANKQLQNLKKQTAVAVAQNSRLAHYILHHNDHISESSAIQASKLWLDLKKLAWRHI